jgi:SAM-dependent methyltransferase
MIDFGKTAEDYARYRVPFAPRLLDRLREFGIGVANQKVLDVAAGTGLLGAALTERGAQVACVDLRFELLNRSNAAGSHIAARTEALPFCDAAFDVVTAAQCWHWFDRHAAPGEILRVLKPHGRVAVIYQTYIPLPGSVAERTEQLILRHRPGWRHANSTGINGQVLRDLQISGFTEIESFSFDLEIPFTCESWRGYIRTSSAVGASMSLAQLSRFDAEHELILQQVQEPLQIPHRIFAAVARRPVARV